MATDYDKGKVTDRERKAAENQREIAGFNAESTANQLQRQLANYDFADAQNRALADLERTQNSRKTEADRFQAQRNLANSAIGLNSFLGPAAYGSTTQNLMRMLADRNDQENLTYWTQHQENQNAVENAYEESINQNRVARNDAIANAEQALRASEADLAANLSNINPNLYAAPGSKDADLGASKVYDENKVAPNDPRASGYIMPDVSAQSARQANPRNRVSGGDYYSQLINRFNGRR